MVPVVLVSLLEPIVEPVPVVEPVPMVDGAVDEPFIPFIVEPLLVDGLIVDGLLALLPLGFDVVVDE
jgi:hypothetical protein